MNYITIHLLSPPNESMAEVLEWFNEAFPEHSPAIAKGCAGITIAMSSLLGLKYFNAHTNPFQEHGVVMPILIAAILVHLSFAVIMKNVHHALSLILSFCVFLGSGIVVTELILFILFTQIWKLALINVSVALLIALGCFINELASFFSLLLNIICFGSRDQPQEPDGGNIQTMEIDQSSH